MIEAILFDDSEFSIHFTINLINHCILWYFKKTCLALSGFVYFFKNYPLFFHRKNWPNEASTFDEEVWLPGLCFGRRHLEGQAVGKLRAPPGTPDDRSNGSPVGVPGSEVDRKLHWTDGKRWGALEMCHQQKIGNKNKFQVVFSWECHSFLFLASLDVLHSERDLVVWRCLQHN